MKRAFLVMTCALVLAIGPAWTRAQENAPTAKSQNAEIFTGMVVSSSASQITVSQKGLSRESITKTFTIDASTKVEGVLKPNAKVTVRYVSDDTGFHAIRILVR